MWRHLQRNTGLTDMHTQTASKSPFHAGEQALQSAIGKRERMEAFGQKVIRDHMPDQHREFYTQLPFLVLGSVDTDQNPWATLVTGETGFVHSPDAQTLQVSATTKPGDRATSALSRGAPIGCLGIELHTRRRNRVNGRIRSLDAEGFTMEVDQAFGNCPQYIQARSLAFVDQPQVNLDAETFTNLPQSATSMIQGADTFFVASAVPAEANPEVEGVDVSHRGGRPGFVRVKGNTLTIPDFRGNNHFNTLGNFVINPKAGLVFPDFASGNLLQLTGTVTLLDDTHPDVEHFVGAERAWQVEVTQGQWLYGALPFSFGPPEVSPRNAQTGVWA